MLTKTTIAIHWFRQDLRLSDNPALCQAAKHHKVLPIYILDNHNAGADALGSAQGLWLHHSLTALKQSLNGNLSIYQGDPCTILNALIKRYQVDAIYWNRCYEPWRIHRDSNLKTQLHNQGIQVHTYNSALLWEPWQVHKKDGAPYKVFTPFYRHGCLNEQAPRTPLAPPSQHHFYNDEQGHFAIENLHLLPKIPWHKTLQPHWHIGEAGAHQRLQQFIADGLAHYKDGRNLPDKPYVSRLSPYLHFGEISPHQVWHTLRSIGNDQHIDHYCSELGWREFSYSLLYHHPDLPHRNLQAKFDRFPWLENATYLQAWQTGQTGVPMVDAGMRELWQTGFMHNRVRMIVGSYLVKNLRLHWRHGERWFWDTLVDADLANNSASWQWIAGCGADAAPYFRIFNPVIQGQKFDKNGHYVRQYVPEIAALPNKYLFNPWEAPQSVLQAAKVDLGTTYPAPIVNLKQSREAALAAFRGLTTLTG